MNIRLTTRWPAAILMTILGTVVTATAAGVPAAVPIGVSQIDITPETPVRMYGYGARKTESEGIAARLYASALVIGGDEGQGPAVILSVENGSVPPSLRGEVYRRLQTKVNLRPERFMLCNTHIHSGPDLEGMPSLAGQEREHMDKYADQLTNRMEKAVLAALAARKPGRLSWAQGSVGFATNRRVLKDGKWTGFGLVTDAPSDHSLPILRITDADGKLRAVFINYACHDTTLRGNFKQIHGDWAGCAREFIQKDFPGVVAMVALGCGSDSDPGSHGTVELCQQHGREVADEVKKLLRGEFKPLSPDITARAVALEIPFDPVPPIDELRKFAEKTYSAAQTLRLVEGGEKPPTSKRYQINAWSFGDDLAMVFLPNEVVVDYGRRLKRELDASRLWANAYCNEVLYYVASRRIIQEGGYESINSLSALVSYGRPERRADVEDRIVEAVRSIVPAGFQVEFSDTFKGKLAPGWSWIRKDPKHWRIGETGLEVHVQPGNMWGPANNAKNVLVRSIPDPKAQPIEITASIQNHPTSQYEQVDLVWYYDDSNMVKIGQELVDGKLSIVMGREQNDRTRTIAIIPLDSDSVELRFVAKEERLRGQFKTPKTDWRDVGECDMPVKGEPKVSLQFYQGPAKEEHWAKVTGFTIRNAQ